METETLREGSPAIGRTCPFCQFTLKPGVDAVTCGSCSSVHHTDCWNANSGCATYGCAENVNVGGKAEALRNLIADEATFLEYASIGRRWIASFGDSILVGLICVPIGLLLGVVIAATGMTGLQKLGNLIGVLVAAAYETYFIGKCGQTPGKKSQKVQVIPVSMDVRMDNTRAFVRYAGKILSTIPCALGFLWALWDPNRQTWHDKLAKTYVVHDKREEIKTSLLAWVILVIILIAVVVLIGLALG